MVERSLSRRSLVKILTLAATGAALAAQQSLAAEAEKLDVKDPAAVAVGYVEDAAQVDPKKYPSYLKGSNCENCLQLLGQAGNSYRPCALFPAKVVSAKGWCSQWAAEI